MEKSHDFTKINELFTAIEFKSKDLKKDINSRKGCSEECNMFAWNEKLNRL